MAWQEGQPVPGPPWNGWGNECQHVRGWGCNPSLESHQQEAEGEGGRTGREGGRLGWASSAQGYRATCTNTDRSRRGDQARGEDGPPFTPSIIAAPLPRNFKLPAIKAYTCSSDPRVHMTRYKAAMMMIGADDAVMCWGFLSMLDGGTQDWFNTLLDGSIQTFAELTKNFFFYFSSNI